MPVIRQMALGLLLLFTLSLLGQEQVDLQMITKIKHEGLKNSQVMETLGYLTDVFGGRLTNSPSYMAAANWCKDQLSSWGLQNAHLEPWGTFGRGWSTEKYSVEMLEPQYMNIIAHPKAWTPGADSAVTGTPILIRLNDNLEDFKGKTAGLIVLVGEPRKAKTYFEPEAARHDQEKLAELAAAPDPAGKSPYAERRKKWRERRRKQKEIKKFLQAEGAAVIVESSSIEHGTLRVTSGGSWNPNEEESLPAVVIAMEHYNRIARLLEREIPVTLSINIQNTFYDQDSLGYNVIAEIPGVDRKRKKELVMLGGHLDSWHSGTGATDDGAGVAVVMEAVRILKTLEVQPRRTIRIALWGGEEQGLKGSRGYAEKHFGNPKKGDAKPGQELVSAYYNIDNGAGKIRGIYLQENDAARPFFEAMLKPFHDMGASTISIRTTGGTDHMAFDAVGIPGFQFIQDPLDYFSRTWHTNMDVLDRIHKGDLMQMSVIVASLVYHTAMRDEKLPRKEIVK